jgi:UDP-N-acetylmuramate dehydrogenase
MTGDLASIEQRGLTEISAMAGAGLGALCRFAIRNGLGGLNFAMGIPGSVGGAIRMNAGAWEGSMGDVLAGIRIIRPDGTIGFMDKKMMEFSYRSLALCAESGLELSACVILEGVFSLTPQDPDMLKTEADTLLDARKKSQPVGSASAGSFFKNPVNQEPAGRLIDLAGCKGLSVGDAEVSPQHANFIVNRGRATARDIIGLMRMVQETVFQKFNILLEPEVKIVGDESTEKKSV